MRQQEGYSNRAHPVPRVYMRDIKEGVTLQRVTLRRLRVVLTAPTAGSGNDFELKAPFLFTVLFCPRYFPCLPNTIKYVQSNHLFFLHSYTPSPSLSTLNKRHHDFLFFIFFFFFPKRRRRYWKSPNDSIQHHLPTTA